MFACGSIPPPQLPLIYVYYRSGAPRVLQALSKDKLYPKIEFFAPGFGANNDPIRGYILVFFISLGCVLIGNYLLQGFVYSDNQKTPEQEVDSSYDFKH